MKKSESYRIEMVEHRDVSAKFEETYAKSIGEINELTGYVRELENVSDQRILAIVQGSEESIALQQQTTERAQQLAVAENQQIAVMDQVATRARR